jgi:HEAT repeat protein
MSLFGVSAKKVSKWVEDRDTKKLFGALEADDIIIRQAAAQGLAKIGGPEVLDFCRANARSDKKEIRWQVTQILATIGTPEAAKIMDTVEDPVDSLMANVKKKDGSARPPKREPR